jgi:hypothetical protein
VRGDIVDSDGSGAVVVRVHVQPRAGITSVAGTHGEALKIRVAAPPVDGRATEAARVALAEAMRVPVSAVELVAGERSRLKRFRIRGLDIGAARERLAVVLGLGQG